MTRTYPISGTADSAYRAAERTCQDSLSIEHLDPAVGRYARQVLAEVPRTHWLTALIMAVTACRWGELPYFDPRALLIGRRVTWQPTKGSAERSVVWPQVCVRTYLPYLPLGFVPRIHEYAAHAAAVRLAARRAGYEPKGCANKATHLWRHLRAWHMIDEGHSVDVIARTLGHRRPDSTEYYLQSRPDSFTI